MHHPLQKRTPSWLCTSLRNRRFWIIVVTLVVAMAWDRAAYLHANLAPTDAAKDQLEADDWYQLFRIMGRLWLWFIISLVFIFIDADKVERGIGAVFRRATLIFLSAALSGAAAEGLKLITGRYRPHIADGYYAFKPISERLTELSSATSNVGLASSDAAIAFGAAFALSYIFPRAKYIFLFLAVGCALARVLVGAHFLSDVAVAAVLSYYVAVAVHALDLKNNQGLPISHTPHTHPPTSRPAL